MSSTRPILVTGAYRSGTTITGRLLAASQEVEYVQEPFNPYYFDASVCSLRFERLFEYIRPEETGPRADALRAMCALLPRTADALLAARTTEERGRVLAHAGRWRAARALGRRALLKDPIAFYAAPWIHARTDAAVVVVVRHPGSFVGSLKRFGWQTAVWNLLAQPELVARRFPDLVEEARAWTSKDADVVSQAAMFWKLTYQTAAQYRDEHQEWIFVTHEDVCRRPLETFERLFGALGLRWTESVRATVDQFTRAGNPESVPSDVTYAPVDGAANARRWYRLLSAEEIARVRAMTQPVAGLFYDEASWSSPG
ncbi:MAG: sulfotransferase [Planctomycetota bacterium]